MTDMTPPPPSPPSRFQGVRSKRPGVRVESGPVSASSRSSKAAQSLSRSSSNQLRAAAFLSSMLSGRPAGSSGRSIVFPLARSYATVRQADSPTNDSQFSTALPKLLIHRVKEFFRACARKTTAGGAETQPRQASRKGKPPAPRWVSAGEFCPAPRTGPRKGPRMAGALAQASLLDGDRKAGANAPAM